MVMSKKFKTFLLLTKNRSLRALLLIDILFYGYLVIGFIVAAKISMTKQIPINIVSEYWVGFFIPILILKLTKEIKKNKIKKDILYKVDEQ